MMIIAMRAVKDDRLSRISIAHTRTMYALNWANKDDNLRRPAVVYTAGCCVCSTPPLQLPV